MKLRFARIPARLKFQDGPSVAICNMICIVILHNLLPEQLRSMNTDHVDLFKNHLDVFLSSIPDQPTMTGLGRASNSNSLLHQLPIFYSQMT